MHKKFDILIIDDEQVILDSVSKICTAEGLSIDTAPDSLTALKKIEQAQYSLIICDIILPDLDGFQFLSRMKARQHHTPVIITTGYATVENAVKSLYSGAIDFLAKPFTVDELLSVTYRGLKYTELHQSKQIMDSDSRDADMPLNFVPCPPKYYRLGYAAWLFPEFDGSVKIGVTDLFLHTIDPIVHTQFFEADDELVQGNVCAHFETEDSMVHQFLSPISGRILSLNDALFDESDLIIKDPYFEGWLYRVVPVDLNYELANLTSCSSDRF
ncbi:MAG: response regulator [Calditrichaeota bacterium]|nr:response regulator [Calditrichota bacterium]MCB0296452.1 response regulator [Calditrichota bacterium]MCB0302967.1 response regulator [Calditrichota bacterium]MCB0313044.1 response regulator [Calditrichota bacterium]MCB9090657.1 response regulator [Calditrichia bacterium]